MKRRIVIGTILIAGLAISGCATKRFGRAQSLSPTEKATLTCQQIVIEKERVDMFLLDVEKQRDDVDIRTIGGWLGDFGIGNSMEGGDAKKSGIERKQALLELEVERGCNKQSAEVVSPKAPVEEPTAAMEE